MGERPIRLSRRTVLALGAAAAGSLAFSAIPRRARALVIGAGAAGTSHAYALARLRPDLSVVLVERDPARFARSGTPLFGQPTAGPPLSALREAGVEIALGDVTEIDWATQHALAFGHRRLAFDRLILAPGTAPRAEDIPGLDAAARRRWPAAWGSPREARRLAAALENVPEGGHLVLRLPQTHLAHPRAALTRALELGHWLARHRSGARMTVLDGGTGAGIAAPFEAGKPRDLETAWLGPGRGGGVVAVDAMRGLIETDAGPLEADAVNFIPPVGAGAIAGASGLTDPTGWCPVDKGACSSLRPAAVILGDARAGARRDLRAAMEIA